MILGITQEHKCHIWPDIHLPHIFDSLSVSLYGKPAKKEILDPLTLTAWVRKRPDLKFSMNKSDLGQFLPCVAIQPTLI